MTTDAILYSHRMSYFAGSASTRAMTESDLLEKGEHRATDWRVDRGFVIRDDAPVDRRLSLCRMSDRGSELIEGFWQPAPESAKVPFMALWRSMSLAVGASLEAPLETGEATKERRPLI